MQNAIDWEIISDREVLHRAGQEMGMHVGRVQIVRVAETRHCVKWIYEGVRLVRIDSAPINTAPSA